MTEYKLEDFKAWLADHYPGQEQYTNWVHYFTFPDHQLDRERLNQLKEEMSQFHYSGSATPTSLAIVEEWLTQRERERERANWTCSITK